VLHSVEGGAIKEDGSIENIITRWTLRVTAKVLPWSPTARFSGISVYEVVPGGPKGVMVEHQTDYWDSINIKNAGEYQKVDKSIAVKDFLDQLKPENAIAPSAGPELPYQVLRRGDGYEVRRYPSYTSVKMPYERRDEGFLTLGSFTSGEFSHVCNASTLQKRQSSNLCMF
jgi:SOUL heme-binding protein